MKRTLLGLLLAAWIAAPFVGCGGSGPTPSPPDTGTASGGASQSPTPSDVPAGITVPIAAPADTDLDFAVLSSSVVDGVSQMEVAYPSDGLTVRGFFFLPDTESVHPAVIFNHGGVSGVSADVKRRARDLARLGYVVVAPAYRGEGGSEGRVEVAAGEVDDVLAAASILAHHPLVDPKRIGIAGSSHGALIAVLAAAREPKRFRCVVEACGVMDVAGWYRYLVENGFDVSDSLSVAVYGSGPEDRPEAFESRDAMRVVNRIRVPVLIQQGEKDKTVPPWQATDFRDALEAAGNPSVALTTYPLLGHAFWFWNDPKYHSPQELAQAAMAWRDFTAFLEVQLRP
jgi:dipeptidyl aminopeptidase/acylaminoacyl peptidase